MKAVTDFLLAWLQAAFAIVALGCVMRLVNGKWPSSEEMAFGMAVMAYINAVKAKQP